MDEPAFPVPIYTDHDKGMTLRDWFAGQALAALIARTDLVVNDGTPLTEGAIAAQSYAFADAMLAQRKED